MKRCVFTSAVALLACSVSISPAFAQAKTAAATPAVAPAAPTTPAPAAPAKWVPPVKGTATIEVLRGPAKIVGKEVVSSFKLKNTSTGSINLLKADQDWYSKERKLITSAAGMYRKPFLPGEVIDFELRAPLNGKPDVDQILFTHANGKVTAKVVKSFDAPAAAAKPAKPAK